MAEASARYHTQYGRHPGEAIFYQCSSPGVWWCMYYCRMSVKWWLHQNLLRDVQDLVELTKMHLDAWKSGKVCSVARKKNVL